jgi:hypothetical protein
MMLFIGTLWGEAGDELHKTETAPPSMEIEITEDTETVEVSIEYMRNALWYYKMYFVEKNLAEARGIIIADYEDRFDEVLDEVKSLKSVDAFLGTTTRYLKVVGTTAIVVFAARTLISMVSEIVSWSR